MQRNSVQKNIEFPDPALLDNITHLQRQNKLEIAAAQ